MYFRGFRSLLPLLFIEAEENISRFAANGCTLVRVLTLCKQTLGIFFPVGVRLGLSPTLRRVERKMPRHLLRLFKKKNDFPS